MGACSHRDHTSLSETLKRARILAYFLEEIKMPGLRIAMIGVKGIPASLAMGGGIESHVEKLSKHLVARGHRVSVYVRPYANPERKKHWEGVGLITLPTIWRKNFDAITHTLLASIHVLFQDVDVIHYHAVGPSTLSWIPRLFKPRAKVIATFHGRDRFHEKWSWLARAYLAFGEWAICRFPHVTIAVSHEIKTFCERMYGRDAIHIPNGVEVARHAVGTDRLRALGVTPGEYFLTLGRLIPVKAHEDAIRAFRHVQTTKKLLIIGDATFDSVQYQATLEKLARGDERIVFMGRRIGDELQQLLAHCYAMIHPSRIEGLSVAILEAMSFGRLVLMSDIPSNRELIDHSGISYPVGDVASLRDMIQWLLSDPVLVRLRGERARDVVHRLYSWDRVIERIESVYRRARNES